MKAYVLSLAKQRGIKPPRGYAGSATTCRTFLDKHAGAKQPAAGEPRAPTRAERSAARSKAPKSTNPATAKTARKQQPSAKASGKAAALPLAVLAAGAGSTVETALKIPYGNKEVALKLGARYRDGGWYGPAGVDLAAFRQRGWV